MTEIWKDVIGYEGYFQVSDKGRFKSVAREIKKGKGKFLKPEKILSPYKMTTGYLGIRAEFEGKRKSFQIHREVAKAFIPNPENKPEVNHIDSDRLNPSANNLEWVTRAENREHAIREGRVPKSHMPKGVRIYKKDSNEILVEVHSRYKAAQVLECRPSDISTAILKNLRVKGHRVENC